MKDGRPQMGPGPPSEDVQGRWLSGKAPIRQVHVGSELSRVKPLRLGLACSPGPHPVSLLSIHLQLHCWVSPLECSEGTLPSPH